MRIRHNNIYSIGLKDVNNNSINLPAGFPHIKQLKHSNGEIAEILKTIVLPSDVRCIESRAFDNLRALNKIDLRNIVYIGDRAFNNTSINSITLDNIQTLDINAFSNCDNLQYITINKSLNDIDFINKDEKAQAKDLFLNIPNLRKLSFILNDKEEYLMALDLAIKGCEVRLLDGSNLQYLNQEQLDLCFQLSQVYSKLEDENKTLQYFAKEQEKWIINRMIAKNRILIQLKETINKYDEYRMNNGSVRKIMEDIKKMLKANNYLLDQHMNERRLILIDKLNSIKEHLKTYNTMILQAINLHNYNDYYQTKMQLIDYLDAEYTIFEQIADEIIDDSEILYLIDDVSIMFVEVWSLVYNERSYRLIK